MKNVLILARGQMAKHFVQWVRTSRIDINHYYITYTTDALDKGGAFVENITYLNIDPTSYMRVKNVIEDKTFSTIFIVIENRKEAEYAYKNVRMITAKVLVVFVSMWEDISFDDDHLTVINVHEVMAGNLYEKLPNVPLIGKNIGLGKGELMEILVPYGSSFAYRHIGSIMYRKWRIVAVYRKKKQIFANSTTMLQPNDRILVIGNPLVLEEVYKKVNSRQGVFPEPFGKNLYLLVDMKQSKEEILTQINESIFLSNKLSKSKLFIRLIHVDLFELIEEIRAMQTNNIHVSVTYTDNKILDDIDFDMSQYDIGLFILNRNHFFNKKYHQYLMDFKRPIYLFGNQSLYSIKKMLLLMGEQTEMESMSSSVFDLSESLNFQLNLCDYSPEGDFQESEQVVKHYESLSRLYSFKINIEKKRVNPIRELLNHNDILHIIPLNKKVKKFSLLNFFSTQLNDYIMSIKKHPQLLIPINSELD